MRARAKQWADEDYDLSDEESAAMDRSFAALLAEPGPEPSAASPVDAELRQFRAGLRQLQARRAIEPERALQVETPRGRVEVLVRGNDLELRQGGLWVGEAMLRAGRIVTGTKTIGAPCSGRTVRRMCDSEAQDLFRLVEQALAQAGSR